MGKRAEAEQAYQRALAIQQQLVQEFPSLPDYARDLGTSYWNLGYILDGRQQWAQAETPFVEARRIRQRLVDEYPDNRTFQHELATTDRQLGRLYSFTNRRDQGLETLRQACGRLERLVRENPTEIGIQVDLCLAFAETAQLLRDSGDLNSALAEYNRCAQAA